MKKTGTTEQALLTNHKPEPHVRRRPSESTTLAAQLIIYPASLIDCIYSSHSIGTQGNRGLAEVGVVQYICAHRRR
uniref:Uncharacterized protein n=1 Tax=Mesocestoides corti TaxID=53468 RepID=A0A5K3F6G9_MESCO